MPAINPQYNVAAPGSLPVRIASRMRKKMFCDFLETLRPDVADSILDVGATSDDTYEASNYLEAWYPHKHQITALGVDDASFLEECYPGLSFVRGDGRELPFPDGHFDIVHSSAVLEHVGSRIEQARFLSELARVARKGVYFTTPNRWFPVEFHSVLPVLHWLPPRAFRRCLTALGHNELAREENLNLLSPADVRRLCATLPRWDATVRTVSLGGWPSNIIGVMRPA